MSVFLSPVLPTYPVESDLVQSIHLKENIDPNLVCSVLKLL